MHTDRTTANPMTTNRRTFLMAGGALLGGAALFRRELIPTNAGLTTLATMAGPRISVGHVVGSAGATSLEEVLAAGAARAVPASTLSTGELSNEVAALAVHGFTPQTATDGSSAFSNVFVDAHIPSPDSFSSEATIPFYAWTFRRAPAPMVSGRSRFVISRSRGLRVGFGVSNDGATATTVFTSGSERSLPRLQPGVFLLGLSPGVWSSPRSLPQSDDAAWSTLASMVVVVDSV